jgi:hypothetical protein
VEDNVGGLAKTGGATNGKSLSSASNKKNVKQAGAAAKAIVANAKLDSYLEAVQKARLQKIQDVMKQIPNRGRRLLAARGYVKFPMMGRGSIDDWWAWTSDEDAAFRKTQDYKDLMAAIKAVKSKFSGGNSGYRLSTASKSRSLIEQINLWNGNKKIPALAASLTRKAKKELGKADYPATPDAAARTKFEKFLKNTYYSPTSATPGLSAHGRLRAVDFVVKKGSTVVAGTSTSKSSKDIWRGQAKGPDDTTTDWEQELNDAVTKGAPDFDGPLKKPDEPWHYYYNP